MPERETDKIILLDADVIIHFIKGNDLLRLSNVYPHQLAVLDIVRDEVCARPANIRMFDLFIRATKITPIPFPMNEIQVLKEFTRLLRENLGRGESACMAYARYHDNIIASSNIRDIKEYCGVHGIQYLTTMDILVEALNKKIMTESECNSFIATVKSKDSKLPCNTIGEYLVSLKKK